jgi:hypothetical protein
VLHVSKFSSPVLSFIQIKVQPVGNKYKNLTTILIVLKLAQPEDKKQNKVKWVNSLQYYSI